MIRHYGIPVKDLDKAVAFYGEFFHFYPYAYETVKIGKRKAYVAKMAHKNGDVLELVQGGVPHISLTVNSLMFDKLKEDYDAELFEKEGVCYIKDEDNNIIEIVEHRGF